MTRHVVRADLTEPGPWWIAHEHPERMVDRWTVWSWDCDACMLHLIAASRSAASTWYAEEFKAHGDKTCTSVASTLAAARAWRAEQGLREL